MDFGKRFGDLAFIVFCYNLRTW